jgi:hypothetical protein
MILPGDRIWVIGTPTPPWTVPIVGTVEGPARAKGTEVQWRFVVPDTAPNLSLAVGEREMMRLNVERWHG